MPACRWCRSTGRGARGSGRRRPRSGPGVWPSSSPRSTTRSPPRPRDVTCSWRPAMSHFVAQSVAEKRAIPHRYAIFAPNVLNDQDAQSWNALFGPSINSHRASIGLPPVDDVREFMFTDQPWLAADPTLGPWDGSADLDVVQTGAWILPDERPLPAELEAFLDAGAPPVYVGFGSMRGVAGGHRPGRHRGDPRAGPPCPRRPRLGRPGPGRRPGRLLRRRRGQPAGTVRPGGRRRAPRRRGHDDDGRPGRRASGGGAPGRGDQPYWAGRVAELGIGAAHDGPTPTTESLSAALRTALTPETRARATAVAGTIRTDGAAVAATLLLERS